MTSSRRYHSLAATIARVTEPVAAPTAAGTGVLIAPPVHAWRVWAGFTAPRASLRLVGLDSDYLAGQRSETGGFRRYMRVVGRPALNATRAIRQTGAAVWTDARRPDVLEAFGRADLRAVFLVAHHVGDGVELADGFLAVNEMQSMAARPNAEAFAFVLIVCHSSAWRDDLRREMPAVLTFAMTQETPLHRALEFAAMWIAELDGRTRIDEAQQRALARYFRAPERRLP